MSFDSSLRPFYLTATLPKSSTKSNPWNEHFQLSSLFFQPELCPVLTSLSFIHLNLRCSFAFSAFLLSSQFVLFFVLCNGDLLCVMRLDMYHIAIHRSCYITTHIHIPAVKMLCYVTRLRAFCAFVRSPIVVDYSSPRFPTYCRKRR